MINEWIYTFLFTIHGGTYVEKVGRVASENVVVELLKTKCLPILLYVLEACPLTQLKSLNYAISSSFWKKFNVTSNEIVYSCRCMLNCADIEDILRTRKRTFLHRYCLLDNVVCTLCRHQADIEHALLSAWHFLSGIKSRSRRLGLETASRLDFDCLGLVSVSGKSGKVSPRSSLEQTFKRLGLERKGFVCIPTADSFWENGANVSVTVADTELFGL